ncbi:hypothetical protein HJFPF1_04160 [Paramyrothecium foliicola]|nr:hypothetical protein HJFPF1_04160 [Paramyrothecium foliicola]
MAAFKKEGLKRGASLYAFLGKWLGKYAAWRSSADRLQAQSSFAAFSTYSVLLSPTLCDANLCRAFHCIVEALTTSTSSIATWKQTSSYMPFIGTSDECAC